jgi:hypothetical protein
MLRRFVRLIRSGIVIGGRISSRGRSGIVAYYRFDSSVVVVSPLGL